jgi:hypothetical protein
MKRYACVTRSGGSLALAGFEDRQPLDSVAEVAGIMVSRLDFDVQIIELPAMPEKEVEAFLSYRIRGLYPGQPERTSFDYRILARGGKRYAVLSLFQRETLEEYRRLADGRPLFSSLSLLLPLLGSMPTGRDLACLFWQDTWLEALVLREGQPPRSCVVKRGAGSASELDQLLCLAAIDLSKADCLAVVAERERAELGQLVAARLSEPGTLKLLSTAQALGRSLRGPAALFTAPKARFPLPRGLRLELGAAILLLLLFLAAKRGADREVLELASLRREVQAAQGRSSQVLALEREVQSLEESSAQLGRSRPPDPYWVLSELQAVLGAGTRINSFILERGTFQLEAVGPDPLRLMEVFKTRGRSFENVKLIQIVPTQDSRREQFRITGYARAP